GLLGHGGKLHFGVTASDVSAAAVATARAAIYPRGRIEEIPAQYRAEYVEMRGEEAFTPIASLRKRVAFARVNLLQAAAAPLQRLNLIFCQNVLMYFARARRRELLDGLAGLLEP
ncbi:methylase of chemotaxis methyl-accepting protein, partial [mine drainage metagenome]